MNGPSDAGEAGVGDAQELRCVRGAEGEVCGVAPYGD